ncbi:MAG: V-type ATP synthase subunit C [Peptococcaceae bacterium]|nr:V-type ATP synthase subunit C [Peptococcaceae bacterium]
MRKYNEIDYAYAVARIRALERKLLDRAVIHRLVDAKSPQEIQAVMGEMEFFQSQSQDSQGGITNYEAVLSAQLREVYNFLRNLAPDPEIFSLFLYKFDVHNIKVYLKEEFQNLPAGGIYVDAGTIPVSRLVQRMRDRDYHEMPKALAAAAAAAIEKFNLSQDPQEIDIEMDRGLYALMTGQSRAADNRFLVDYVRTLIDLSNIKTFFRIRNLSNAWSLMERVIYENGTLPVTLYRNAVNEPVDAVLSRFKGTAYQQYVEESVEHWQKTDTMTAFEKGGDEMMMEYIRKSRYKAFGVEPLVAYLLIKENEIKILRMILVGKVNQMEPEIIRERLGRSYA